MGHLASEQVELPIYSVGAPPCTFGSLDMVQRQADRCARCGCQRRLAIMHIGVVGVGRIGAFHARVLSEHPEVRRLSISDIDGARAAAVAERLGAYVESADHLLEHADGIVIATDTAGHASLIERAARPDRPVFCEKPIALELETTRSIVDRVGAAGAVVQIGFQRRFDAAYRRARAAVQDGTLGRIYIIRTAGHDAEPPHESYISTSGGIFRDLNIHDFDIIRYVTGQDIIEVYADGGVLGHAMYAKYDDVDTAVAVLRLNDGALAIMSGARHDPRGYDIRMELLGSADSIAVGMGERMPLRSLEAEGFVPVAAWSSFLDRFGDAYREELHAFVDVIAGRQPNPCPPEEALIAMRVAVACDRSLREHRPVRIAEIDA
jgi:myo-inositol 2-dehydrogenase/D-chiro-inositol 1-dehydrogenase